MGNKAPGSKFQGKKEKEKVRSFKLQIQKERWKSTLDEN